MSDVGVPAWISPTEVDSLILGRLVPEEAVQVVSGKSNMSKRYTAEFKRDAVALVRSSPHRNITEIARELGVSPEGLRGWVKQDSTDRGQGPAGALTSAEKDELARLRRQNREQQQTIEILKKSRGLLRHGVDEIGEACRFIDAEKAAEANPGGYSVALLCRVMGINRSTYYAWLAARPAVRIRQEAEDGLAGEILGIHAGSRGAYGAPRVHAALKRGGHAINRKKVERIMRERGISGITRRKRRHLTVQDGRAAPAPDLVGRDFTAARTGAKLVGDITYLPTIEGWWYLATIIDLATREVIGYAMADHHRAELVTDALWMAAGRGGLQPGCIMHTDRGSEYTSGEFRSLVMELNLRQSMGRTGICRDNAAAESFFGLLKAEIGTTVWESRQAARADVFRFIEVEYNRTRLRKHPEFGYLTPLETRARLQHGFTPAA
ncbi:IS3 family transposase [Streptomyces sp. 8L]|uniref:IS3 family transposase n=1 Tax=Streptomyces sp. 8L TaxID=2877242 RepID=UPI001CD78E29|nr:IS3 family transposase [Streptomyces sp. 8L]MCA1224128.1 IS3 family transposase [Streptomyces sp. 8L]